MSKCTNVQTNNNPYTKKDRPRRTGESLGLALRSIGMAMEYPGVPIPITDHHPTNAAHRFLGNTIVDLIDQLKLKGFTYKRLTNELVYTTDWIYDSK